MENPFKQILRSEELPETIRQKVIDDINFINLSLDLADLFLVKNPDVIKSILGDESEEEEEEE